METVLSVNQLTKYYGAIRALNNISFNIPKGSIFGILGPNGSGKTTFLGIVMNVLKANSGTYSWLGETAGEEDRKKIGTLLETPNFYPYLSAKDNLLLNTIIKECPRSAIDHVLKTVDLYERRNSAFKTFSLGMKQRLAIAAALLGDPEIIVLDEPTNGLDPVGIADIRNLIIQMGAAGKTVIMASHLLDEVEKVCTHVAILKKGNILATGPVEEVLSSEDVIEVRAANMNHLREILEKYPNVKTINPNNGNLLVTLEKEHTSEELNAWCFEQQVTLNLLHKHQKNLELKFLELTKEK